MAKITFDEVMDKINDGMSVSWNDVQAKALRRKVWLAEWHIPGCLSDSQSYCLTKEDAIETCCMYAEGEEGIPRGMKTSLRKYGRFDSESVCFGDCINTIDRLRLGDIL